MWESGEPRQVTWGTGTVLPESEAPLTPLVLTAGGSREPAIHPSVSGGIDVIGKAERGTVRPVAVGGQMPWGEAVSQGCERLWALTGRGREAKGRRKSRRKQQAHPSLYKQPPPTAQMQIFSFVGGGQGGFRGPNPHFLWPLPRAQTAGPYGWGLHVSQNAAGHRDLDSSGLSGSLRPATAQRSLGSLRPPLGEGSTLLCSHSQYLSDRSTLTESWSVEMSSLCHSWPFNLPVN